MIKNITLLAAVYLISFNYSTAQISEIEGSLKLPNLEQDATATDFVVKQPDGTLAHRIINTTDVLPIGTIVMSELDNDTNLLNNGFQQIGSTSIDLANEDSSINIYGSWRNTSIVGAPIGKRDHSAVWSGTEMLIWGGYSGAFSGIDEAIENTGGKYNPISNSWTPISTINAPEARFSHQAVWTGTEMIIWGGRTGSPYLTDGKKYDPITDSWSSISSINAPSGRSNPDAIWTGTEMIIWGGRIGGTFLTDGKKYNPVNDSWTDISNLNVPIPSINYSLIWTGEEMIVWGGDTGNSNIRLRSGSKYNPSTDTWSNTNLTGAPTRRSDHAAAWSGTEMIVWGGRVYTGDPISTDIANDGRKYNPMSDSWSTMTNVNTAVPRSDAIGIWTGSDFVVWGGQITVINSFDSRTNTGKRYDLSTNTWLNETSTTCAPKRRMNYTSIWTGTELIIWGGFQEVATNTGSIFNPTDIGFAPTQKKQLYIYQKL